MQGINCHVVVHDFAFIPLSALAEILATRLHYGVRSASRGLCRRTNRGATLPTFSVPTFVSLVSLVSLVPLAFALFVSLVSLVPLAFAFAFARFIDIVIVDAVIVKDKGTTTASFASFGSRASVNPTTEHR